MAPTRPLPSRDEILAALGEDRDYARVGRTLGIAPGLAYLAATGLAADGGDSISPEDTDRRGAVAVSTQHLANPSSTNPTSMPGRVQRWVRDRVGQDAAMQEAARGRTAEPPETEESEEDTSVVAVLGRQHGQVKAMVEELSAIPGVKQGGTESDMSRRQSIIDMIAVAASGHEAVEEELFWPRVRQELEDGETLADQALAQEQRGAEVLAALGELTGREERFDDLVEELVAALRQHMAYEDRVFRAIEEQVRADDLQAWGQRVRKAIRRAPTRPHTRAPRRSEATVKAAGAAAATLDKVRDAVGSRPADRKGRPEPGAEEPLRWKPAE